MRELLPGIFNWTWFSERNGYDFNGWLIRDPGGNLCVDPVEPTAEALATLEREGVARVVITNRNHYRASMAVKQRTGATISIHPADAAFAVKNGVAVDGELQAGQRVGPFTVIGAPGKSPGEVALHWVERRILIVGDACVGKPPGALALLPLRVIDDVSELQRSLRKLAELDIETLLLGDGASMLSGGQAALQKLVASF
jgi:glyoxylase-like metal-dependent hydrolase (beta-lactamase superfamily II)